MSPKFTKTSVRKSENLGEKLSKKRVSLGYEIKDIERAIKIRANHIEYIENSDWESLPPDVFVRGFLKSYAKFLKLNPEKVVTLYIKERNLKTNVTKATTKEEKKSKTPSFSKPIVTPKKITFATIALIGLAIFGYIGWQLSILAAPPKLEILSPAENTKTNLEKIIIEGKTDAGAKVLINNFEVGVSPEGDFKEELSLQSGVNLIHIKAVSRLEREKVATRTVISEPKGADENVNAMASEMVMALAIGPNPTTLSILINGSPLSGYQGENFLPGTTQTIRAKEKIEITASNAGSVRIILDEKNLGLLGPEGQRINRVFTKESN